MIDLAIQAGILTESSALQNGAALQPRPEAGVLRLTGLDRADFLHRMTTNQINGLRPGQSAVTVLTSPIARIVHVFTVVCRSDELWLLPAPGAGMALERHLRGQIFFMDQVKVENISEETGRLRMMGPKATAALSALAVTLEDAADGAWQEHHGLLAVKQMGYDVPGYELLAPVATIAGIEATLRAAGALTLRSADAYTARRVELGRPAPGHELVEEFSPLEAGLAWACADNKGCYTGQEIIARQITYDKVTKALVGLCSDEPFAVGAAVTAGPNSVGMVTSAAFSATLAKNIALAVVKRPHNSAGVEVQVDGFAATVAALPFVQQ